MFDQVLFAAQTMLVMGGWVALVVLCVLVGKTLIDLIGDRVYGRMDNKKRPGRTRGA